MDWKKKIAAVVFLLSLVCVPVAAFLLPDQAFSKTERRKLAKKPAFTVAAFWDGTYMEQLETYFSEQFPVRDGLRTVKAETETALLGKADTNGYFKVEDGIYHLEAELNEKNVGRVAEDVYKRQVNYRSNLWTGEEARKCIETILPYVDIFFCSEDTARLTFGKTGTINEIQKSFCEEYPISVVASTERTVITPKKHNFTSIIYSAKNDTYYRENPYNNIDVVDRIGSGDAYVSGALYGYLKHGDCQKALEYGNAMAAIKHSVIGDMVFTDLEEIDSIIKQHKNTSGYQSEMNR